MAPKTPTSSKLPKPPTAGGSIALGGIPAPTNVLQRRSFLPGAGPAATTKTFRDNMTPEQQALLAEAISIHSPGLLATPTANTNGETQRPGSGGGGHYGQQQQQQQQQQQYSSQYQQQQYQQQQYQQQQYQQQQQYTDAAPHVITSQSPIPGSVSSSGQSSPAALASPLTYRSTTSQLGRRPSTSRLGPGMNAEAPSPVPTNGSRPASYTGSSPQPHQMAPSGPGSSYASHQQQLQQQQQQLQQQLQQQPLRAPGSPSGARPALTQSRLSTGSASGKTGLMRQPMIQKPGTTPGPTGVGASLPLPASGQGPRLGLAPGGATPVIAPPSLDDYELGDRIIVESMGLTGYLRFLGQTDFKPGTWAGIELDTPTGKNDGSVGGVVYFNCRPKCGIFVLAAKIAKSELLFPSIPVQTQEVPVAAQVAAPHLDHTNHHPANGTSNTTNNVPNSINSRGPAKVDHAAQAASRITAGSRASKYIGMTATQLKQRQVMPGLSNVKTSFQGAQAAPATPSLRSSSPTVKAPWGNTRTGTSPTTPRTITPGGGSANNSSTTPGRANSPSPALTQKPLTTSQAAAHRASSPTTRPPPTGARLSQVGARSATLATATAASNNTKPGAHSRSTSSTSSTTQSSPAGPGGARSRTSPTPTRSYTSTRRLSSRSDTPDTATLLSPSESRSNLLDQASAIQSGNGILDAGYSQQLHQLQLDIGVVEAENNMLRTEVSQTKSQLETSRLLLDKSKELSYEEKVFLSKSLGREVIDERIGQELEELHLMKESWDKEKKAKEQEIKVMTEKMTQAWLEAARSQKERTALLQEKSDLMARLQELQENGEIAALVDDDVVHGEGEDAENGTPITPRTRQHQQEQTSREIEEQKVLIAALNQDLIESDEKSKNLEAKLVEISAKVQETEQLFQGASAAAKAEITEQYEGRVKALEHERDMFMARSHELESSSAATHQEFEDKFAELLRSADSDRQALEDRLTDLEQQVSAHQHSSAETLAKLETAEHELAEARSLLTRSEKVVKAMDEKAREFEALATKREQEIVGLKSELDDLAGMVQSEEVDRMRKVWEHEKKRLEEAVTDNIIIMTTLRTEIQQLESNEDEWVEKAKGLETSLAAAVALKATLEQKNEILTQQTESLSSQVEEERAKLEAYKVETQQQREKAEAIALTVDDWRERCEAMQLEMIQKSSRLEDLGFDLETAVAAQELLKSETGMVRKDFEDKLSGLKSDHEKALLIERQQTQAAKEERDQLQLLISELQEALALSTQSSAQEPAAVSGRDPTELEEELANLKQMVHELTRENVTVSSENKKLMQEHDNLMEAHKHVETECLKLMDEVERLHAESLATTPMESEEGDDDEEAKDVVTMLPADETLKLGMTEVTIRTTAPKKAASQQNQSQSVIRLESLLKEKQALLDRLVVGHATEMRELRLRHLEADRTKAFEISQLNKELAELESLVESKIFHEADLEEAVSRKQKRIERLEMDIKDLNAKLTQLPAHALGQNGHSSAAGANGRSTFSGISSPAVKQQESLPSRARQATSSSVAAPLFCEICEVEGHDLISCVAVFGSASANPNGGITSAPATLSAASAGSRSFAAAGGSASLGHSASSPFLDSDLTDERPYCENCEEFAHYTDECPNESLVF